MPRAALPALPNFRTAARLTGRQMADILCQTRRSDFIVLGAIHVLLSLPPLTGWLVTLRGSLA